jgi:prolactin regulatory element-binding protein
MTPRFQILIRCAGARPLFFSHYLHSLQLVLATTHNLFVYELSKSGSSTTTGMPSSIPKKRKKSKTTADGPNATPRVLTLRHTLNVPSSTGEGATFRSTR